MQVFGSVSAAAAAITTVKPIVEAAGCCLLVLALVPEDGSCIFGLSSLMVGFGVMQGFARASAAATITTAPSMLEAARNVVVLPADMVLLDAGFLENEVRAVYTVNFPCVGLKDNINYQLWTYI
jgi:hypothetical protein